MRAPEGTPSYDSWRGIDYQPAIRVLLPSRLPALLPPGRSVLEIGCGTGDVAIYLAGAGLRVVGVDISQNNIDRAIAQSRSVGLDERTTFRAGDFLAMDVSQADAVVMIRVLTCFSSAMDRQSLLEKALSCLTPGGLLYVHDFMIASDDPQYQRRYREGETLGLGSGNFRVYGPSGDVSFVAHHHSEEEVRSLQERFETILLRIHESLSMNGNRCCMFEFIGRALPAATHDPGSPTQP